MRPEESFEYGEAVDGTDMGRNSEQRPDACLDAAVMRVLDVDEDDGLATKAAAHQASIPAGQVSESAHALREVLLAILSLETAARVHSERIAQVRLEARGLAEAVANGVKRLAEAQKLLGALQTGLELQVREYRGTGDGDGVAGEHDATGVEGAGGHNASIGGGSPVEGAAKAGKMCSMCRVVLASSCFSRRQWVTR